MPEENRIAAAAPKDAATFTISVNGQAVSNELRVAAITVFKAVGRIPFARLEIYDGDPSGQTFEASSGDSFVPGNEIEITAGYRSTEDPVFKGIVISQKLRVRTPGPGILTVYARHPLFKATLQRRSRTFFDLTDDQVLEQIASEYDTTLNAEASGLPTHEKLVQWHATDWDFMLSRAESNGLLFIPTDSGADLIEPPSSGEPVLSLTYGATILEMDVEMDARSQPAETTALTWDPATQETVDSTAGEPSLPDSGNLNGSTLSDAHGQSRHFMHPGAVVSEELDAYAKGRMSRSRLARIQGRIRCEGTPEPMPGELMELNGAGDRFNGQHLISAVRHTLKSGGWTTDIQFGLGDSVLLEEAEDVPAPPAAAMIPPVHGLAIGRVTAIESDPASEYRVQVSIPTLGDQSGPFWARLATLDAGDSRGTFFYPEFDDEVVIGFLSDDPRHPVILGSLYSSGRPAPLEPADANPEKGFVSRESLKALFNDEAKSIQLETPNGNILELSEDSGGIRLEDENGNKIVLDSSGITIESIQDIILKAPGNIQFDATTNLDLAAGAQLKAEGAAGAEFSAGGNVTIKGALVQIN